MSSGKTNVIISDDTIDTSFWLKYDNIRFIIISAGTVTLSPDIYFIDKIVTRSRTDSSSTLSFSFPLPSAAGLYFCYVYSVWKVSSRA
jgi:hypothetical protein